jgi:hypothetical protein
VISFDAVQASFEEKSESSGPHPVGEGGFEVP